MVTQDSYAGSNAPAPSVQVAGDSTSFFEIAPKPDATSFQVGYLGLAGFDSWIVGDVLTKLDSGSKFLAHATRCDITLRASESVHDVGESVQLFASTQTLWRAGSSSTSSVPSVLPFRFALYNDMPQCLHLPSSELVYQLTATLYGPTADTMTSTTLVHPVRYMRPEWEALASAAQDTVAENGDAAANTVGYSTNPVYWSFQSPIQAYVKLERTVLRRTEPVKVQVHIPPQPDTVMRRHLRLRSVEVSLVRVIVVHPSRSTASDRALEQLMQKRAQDPRTVYESVPLEEGGLARAQVFTIAHTGKLCRFHSQRALNLSLALHPSSTLSNIPTLSSDSGNAFWGAGNSEDGPCESIMQSTRFHDVRFGVHVRVTVLGERDEHHDIVATRLVKVMPGPAGPAVEEHDPGAEPGIGDAATAAAQHGDSGKKKAPRTDEEEIAALFDGQPEYDGYEDASGAGDSDARSVLFSFSQAASMSPPDPAAGVPLDHTRALQGDEARHMLLPLSPEQPPRFDEASPTDAAADLALPSGHDTLPTQEEDYMPPSYADSAPLGGMSLRRSAGSPEGEPPEAFPPAYWQNEQQQDVSGDVRPHAPAGFPPLYEA